MYSIAGKVRLNSCHIDLQTIFYEAEKWGEGIIFCGWRGEADQNKAFMENKSKVRWPNSYHNKTPSMAVDAGPYFIQINNTDWNDRLAFAVYAGEILHLAKRLLREEKITHELVWGGDWDSDGMTTEHKFLDLPHFQLDKVPQPHLIVA